MCLVLPKHIMLFHMLYPADRWVTEKQIMSWASDAFANEEADHQPADVYDAISILNDTKFTFTNERRRVTT